MGLNMLLTILTLTAILLPIMLSVAGIFVSIEDRKPTTKAGRSLWRVGLLVVGAICSLVIFLQQWLANSLSTTQARQDLNAAVKPLTGEIHGLRAQVADLGKQTVPSIAQHSKTGARSKSASPDRRERVVIDPSSVATRAAPSTADITFSQRQVVSTDPQLGYEYQVIIQTSKQLDQVHLGVLGDTPISDSHFFIIGHGAMMEVAFGVSDSNPDEAIVKFGYPSFTPDAPIVVTVRTKQPWKAQKVIDLRGES